MSIINNIRRIPLVLLHTLCICLTLAAAATSENSRGDNTQPLWKPASPYHWPHHHNPWPNYPNPYRDDLLRVWDPKNLVNALNSPLWHKGGDSLERKTLHQDVHRPISVSHENAEFPNSFIRTNHSLSNRVTHSYFSLGDHSKWWKKKNDKTESSKDRKDAKERGHPVTNVLAHPRKQNYSAFVLGAPRYSLITTQRNNSTGKDQQFLESLRIDTELKKTAKKATKSSISHPEIKGDYPNFQDIEKRKQKEKHLRLAKVVRTKIGKSSKNTYKLDIRLHGRRSSVPHPGFFKHYTPECALHTNRSFCLVDDTYPKELMKEQLILHKDMLSKLWRPYTPINSNNTDPKISSEIPDYTEKRLLLHPHDLHTKGHKGHQRSKEPVEHKGYSCSTHRDHRMLSQAKNTRGNWKMIVNVEGSGETHLVQTTSLEQCSGTGSSCDLLPKGLATSRCIQRHTIHNLLTWEPKRGFYVDSYSLPTACVCYVSQINLSLIKSYIEY